MTEIVSAAVAADHSTPVLSAKDVTKTFKVAGGSITAVDNVSVDFTPARCWRWWASRGRASRPWPACCCG